MTREEAIHRLKNTAWLGTDKDREETEQAIDMAIEALSAAEPKTGHWYIREYEYFTCSECGEDYWNSCDSTAEAEELLETGDYPNFCPNCGADMRGGEEDGKKKCL